MLITRTSLLSGMVNTLEIDVKPEQLAAYANGTLLDRAFPGLAPPLREFIMTGITPEEWTAKFGRPAPEPVE